MKTSIVIGLGELGSVFANGLLKSGYVVVPVSRHDNLTAMSTHFPAPDSVWLCVGEKDIDSTMASIPPIWHSKLVLIQNELLPNAWLTHQIHYPTVISVWFEKKVGKLPQVVLPSVVYGPLTEQVLRVYEKLDLPVRALASDSELLFELVLKNVYIQTTNIAGLQVGGNTQQLVEAHGDIMQAVLNEVILLQQALTQQTFDTKALTDGFITACYGDPNHGCMGRSAPARLQRALALGASLQLSLPTLSEIAQQHQL